MPYFDNEKNICVTRAAAERKVACFIEHFISSTKKKLETIEDNILDGKEVDLQSGMLNKTAKGLEVLSFLSAITFPVPLAGQAISTTGPLLFSGVQKVIEYFNGKYFAKIPEVLPSEKFNFTSDHEMQNMLGSHLSIRTTEALSTAHMETELAKIAFTIVQALEYQITLLKNDASIKAFAQALAEKFSSLLTKPGTDPKSILIELCSKEISGPGVKLSTHLDTKDTSRKEKWHAHSAARRPGIRREDKTYKPKGSNPSKYGYRLLFPNETVPSEETQEKSKAFKLSKFTKEEILKIQYYTREINRANNNALGKELFDKIMNILLDNGDRRNQVTFSKDEINRLRMCLTPQILTLELEAEAEKKRLSQKLLEISKDDPYDHFQPGIIYVTEDDFINYSKYLEDARKNQHPSIATHTFNDFVGFLRMFKDEHAKDQALTFEQYIRKPFSSKNVFYTICAGLTKPLRNMNFSGGDFSQTCFFNLDFQRSIFNDCKFNGAHWLSNNLSGCSMQGADFTSGNFNFSHLLGANMGSSTLNGAIFQASFFNGDTDISGAKGSPESVSSSWGECKNTSAITLELQKLQKAMQAIEAKLQKDSAKQTSLRESQGELHKVEKEIKSIEVRKKSSQQPIYHGALTAPDASPHPEFDEIIKIYLEKPANETSGHIILTKPDDPNRTLSVNHAVNAFFKQLTNEQENQSQTARSLAWQLNASSEKNLFMALKALSAALKLQISKETTLNGMIHAIKQNLLQRHGFVLVFEEVTPNTEPYVAEFVSSVCKNTQKIISSCSNNVSFKKGKRIDWPSGTDLITFYEQEVTRLSEEYRPIVQDLVHLSALLPELTDTGVLSKTLAGLHPGINLNLDYIKLFLTGLKSHLRPSEGKTADAASSVPAPASLETLSKTLLSKTGESLDEKHGKLLAQLLLAYAKLFSKAPQHQADYDEKISAASALENVLNKIQGRSFQDPQIKRVIWELYGELGRFYGQMKSKLKSARSLFEKGIAELSKALNLPFIPMSTNASDSTSSVDQRAFAEAIYTAAERSVNQNKNSPGIFTIVEALVKQLYGYSEIYFHDGDPRFKEDSKRLLELALALCAIFNEKGPKINVLAPELAENSKLLQRFYPDGLNPDEQPNITGANTTSLTTGIKPNDKPNQQPRIYTEFLIYIALLKLAPETSGQASIDAILEKFKKLDFDSKKLFLETRRDQTIGLVWINNRLARKVDLKFDTLSGVPEKNEFIQLLLNRKIIHETFAKQCIAEGKFEKARERLEEAETLHSKTIECRNNMGQPGLIRGASPHLILWGDWYADFKNPARNLAKACTYYNLASNEEDVKALVWPETVSFNSFYAKQQLARCHFESGDLDAASAYINQAIRVGDTFYSAENPLYKATAQLKKQIVAAKDQADRAKSYRKPSNGRFVFFENPPGTEAKADSILKFEKFNSAETIPSRKNASYTRQ